MMDNDHWLDYQGSLRVVELDQVVRYDEFIGCVVGFTPTGLVRVRWADGSEGRYMTNDLKPCSPLEALAIIGGHNWDETH